MKYSSFCIGRNPIRWAAAVVFVLVVLCGAFGLHRQETFRTDSFLGRWYCPEKPALELLIQEETITINQLTFCYEKTFPFIPHPSRQTPQTFVIDGESMGLLSGSYFVEKGKLYLTVNSQEKIFLSPRSARRENPCSAD